MISYLNDFSLWSAHFGIKLLERINLKPNIKVLDIGCGLGFPSIELAMRLDKKSHVFGIDPWKEGIAFAKEKAFFLEIKNASFLKQFAENLSFEDQFFDLIVSNIGLSNVQNFEKACFECARVAKKDAQFIFSMPSYNMLSEFYDLASEVIRDINLDPNLNRLEINNGQKLKNPNTITEVLRSSNFKLIAHDEHSFTMNFVDGASLFNHQFIKEVYYPVWINSIEKSNQIEVFTRIEQRINEVANLNGGFKIEIPFSIYSFIKE